jgi:hypothetical protein
VDLDEHILRLFFFHAAFILLSLDVDSHLSEHIKYCPSVGDRLDNFSVLVPVLDANQVCGFIDSILHFLDHCSYLLIQCLLVLIHFPVSNAKLF